MKKGIASLVVLVSCVAIALAMYHWHAGDVKKYVSDTDTKRGRDDLIEEIQQLRSRVHASNMFKVKLPPLPKSLDRPKIDYPLLDTY